MSYWDDKQPEEVENAYLSSDLKESGSKVTVQFIGMEMEKQNEEAQFKTKDGMQWKLTFKMKNDKGEEEERYATQGTLNGRMISAMRDAGVEPGDRIEITRVGTGTGTNYLITKQPAA